MKLVPADAALSPKILDATFAIWHEGLSRAAYGRWWEAQRRIRWGQERVQRFALVDDTGAWRASAKRYRFDVRIDGRHGWMSGLGAIFTPSEHRGRGYASRLIELLLDRDRREGALVAGLFSEIGADFYGRHGFRPIPFTDVTVEVTRKDGAPAVLVRAGEERDLPALSAMHDSRCGTARFALMRDPAAIQYALSKKRLLAGLGPPGLRQVEFVVAEEGASAVAYAVLHQNASGWTLEEAGDRDPAGARLGAILQTLVAREPARPAPLIRAVWPSGFPVPPQVQLKDRSPSRDLFMLRPLVDLDLPTRADEIFYWHSDYF